MKVTRLIVIACVLFALIAPLPAAAQSTSESPYYVDVKGSVYNQAFPVNGARVTLWTVDPVNLVQLDQVSQTVTDSRGVFIFPYVVFQPGAGTFQYMVRAERGSDVALALVYTYPPTGVDEPAYVAPVVMDISVPSRYSEVTVNVFSTASNASKVPVPVPGASLTLFAYDQKTGNRTQIGSAVTTDSAGQHVYGSLQYGMYIVRAEKAGLYREQQFAAYQQVVGNVNLNTDMPIPTPTPTPVPGASPGARATPGFEAVAVLIALLGAALYLRRA